MYLIGYSVLGSEFLLCIWLHTLKYNNFKWFSLWCQWDVTKHNLNAKLFCFFQVGLSTSEAKVRDLFEHKDLGIYKNSFRAKVNPSGVIMVKLTPIHYELWFRQCLVRKRFGERSEPSHFFRWLFNTPELNGVVSTHFECIGHGWTLGTLRPPEATLD